MLRHVLQTQPMQKHTTHTQAPVTQLNLIGYLIAFAAVCFYNYQKIQSALLTNKNKGWAPLSAVDGKRVSVHANSSVTMPTGEKEALLGEKESNTADVQYVPALNTPTKLTPLKAVDTRAGV